MADPEDVGASWFLQAFWELNTGREVGWGAVGPISWRDIVTYASIKGLEPDVRDMFTQVIFYMDAVYLKHEAKRRAEERGGGEKPQYDR